MSHKVRLLFSAVLVMLFGRYLLYHFNEYGPNDWDQHLFYYGSFVKNIFEYKQMPYWNPWYCGGNVLWQNPQIPIVSPAYILALFFPMHMAMKLNILLHYFIALAGMNFIGYRLFKIRSFVLCIVGSSIFVFNSYFALQIAEGHTWIFAFAYIPFAYYFFHQTLERHTFKNIITFAAFVALMILSSGIYPLFYFTMFCSITFLVRMIKNPSFSMVRACIFVVLFAAGLSCIKVIPMFAFTRHYPRIAPHNEMVHPKSLGKVFLGRYSKVKLRHLLLEQRWNWIEYGCFIGYGLLILLVLSLFYCFVQPTQLSITSALGVVFFLIIYLGRFADFAPYALYDHLPFVSSLRVPGRSMIIWTFCAGLCIFHLLKRFERSIMQNQRLMFVPTLLLLITIPDLFSVSSVVYREAVGIPASAVEDVPKKKPVYKVVHDIPGYGATSSLYKAMIQNISIWECYEPQQAHRGHRLGYPLVFAKQGATIRNIRFSPNRITFDAQVTKATQIQLNQNYAHGWRINLSHANVTMDDNLPAIQLKPGRYKNVSFTFTPPYLNQSYIIFAITLFVIVLLLRRKS